MEMQQQGPCLCPQPGGVASGAPGHRTAARAHAGFQRRGRVSEEASGQSGAVAGLSPLPGPGLCEPRSVTTLPSLAGREAWKGSSLARPPDLSEQHCWAAWLRALCLLAPQEGRLMRASPLPLTGALTPSMCSAGVKCLRAGFEHLAQQDCWSRPFHGVGSSEDQGPRIPGLLAPTGLLTCLGWTPVWVHDRVT